MTSSILITDAECLKTEHGNHYAIVTFSPKRMTDTTLFLFEKGRYWTNDEKIAYIRWFFSPIFDGGVSINTITLNATLQECQKVRRDDPYVDWNNVSRRYFKYVTQRWSAFFGRKGFGGAN